jgi:hypothetical protein
MAIVKHEQLLTIIGDTVLSGSSSKVGAWSAVMVGDKEWRMVGAWSKHRPVATSSVSSNKFASRRVLSMHRLTSNSHAVHIRTGFEAVLHKVGAWSARWRMKWRMVENPTGITSTPPVTLQASRRVLNMHFVNPNSHDG